MCLKHINSAIFVVIILFSSSRESESETNETVIRSKKENDNSDDSSEDTDTTVFRSLRETNFNSDETELNKDSLPEEVIRGNPEKNMHADLKEKILIINLASYNPNEDRKRTLTTNKIQFPDLNLKLSNAVFKAKAMEDSESVEDKAVFKAKTTEDSESVEDEAIQKEILRARQLRKAYGDACTQVVLRKCYKAMKNVAKDICRSGKKCSSGFKNDFKENAMTGCDRQFNNLSSKSTFRNEVPGQTGALSAQFYDYTRQGYLTMTCLRTLSDGKESLDSEPKPANNDTQTRNVNVLRDRYEKACQKASYEKCIEAAKYAVDRTCSAHECAKSKEKAAKKSYKRWCSRIYGYRTRSSSSDSDSDSDSDSNSS